MLRTSRALPLLVGLVLLALAPPSAGAASSAARSADAYRAVPGTPPARHAGRPRAVDPERFHAFAVDHAALRDVLGAAPQERPAARGGGATLTVALPGPDGEDRRFAVQGSSVLSPELAAAHPEIRTYAGVGVDDPGATVRIDLTPLGLHASVRGPEGQWYVDPYYRGDRSLYVAYRREDLGESVHGPLVEPESPLDPTAIAPFVPTSPRAGGTVVQRTYRLALATDPTYATFFGAQNVLAAKTVLIDRVDQLYNDDLAVRLELADRPLPVGTGAGQDPSGDALNLDTNAEMYGANGPCGTAPCYPIAPADAVCADAVLDANATAIGQLMRGAPFDIGHIALGTPGGGVAALSAVGRASKAQGCTGVPAPVGDAFAVDYVAHEMGHQFGGNHTFAGTQENCASGNRNDGPGTEGATAPGTAVEPGSGSSVMAYAGICGSDDLQPHSDPYFSQRSIAEITHHTVASFSAEREVQTVSLRSFDTGDAFALRTGDQTSAPISAAQYTAATLRSRLAAIGIPGTTVRAFRGSGTLGREGFSVEFTADTADHAPLEVVDGTGDATGFSGETVKGGAPTNGGTAVATANVAPTVTAPAAITVPARTPFTLTGAGTDPDDERLLYTWEQNDPSASGGTSLVSNVKTTGPLFRLFGVRAAVTPAAGAQYPSPGRNVATEDPSRTFPDLAQVVAGTTNAATGRCPDPPAGDAAVPAAVVECFAEFLPTADYTGTAGGTPRLHFRLTARDARPLVGGGTGAADVEVRVDRTAGPFRVTSQATASSAAAGGPLTVRWDRAGTDDATTNAQAVRIRLSTDGGRTFPTVLAASTPNDDAQTVTLPTDAEAAAARVMVEAVGAGGPVTGTFFDVSHADLTITAPTDTGGSTDPTDPGGPTDPSDPGGPADPSGPASPTDPGTPTVPAAPPTAVEPGGAAGAGSTGAGSAGAATGAGAGAGAGAGTSTPPVAAPRPAGVLRPSLGRLAARVRAARTGRVRLAVRCTLVPGTGTAPTRCAGTVRLRARVAGRTVVVGTATLAGGRTGATVTVRLTARGRALARRAGGLRAQVVVTVRSTAGDRTATKAVRVIAAR